MTFLDRLFGRSAEVAARALLAAARPGAPGLARELGVDDALGRAATLLLAKLCFDRAVPQSGAHGHGGLQLSVKASSQLYPAIAFEFGGTPADAGRRYVNLADAVRRGLESRAPSDSGTIVVARELRRAMSGDAGADVSPALAATVDRLIKEFSAITARALGGSVARQEGAAHGR